MYIESQKYLHHSSPIAKILLQHKSLTKQSYGVKQH